MCLGLPRVAGGSSGQVWRPGLSGGTDGWLRARGAWGEQGWGEGCCVEDHLSRLLARSSCEWEHVGTPRTASGCDLHYVPSFL